LGAVGLVVFVVGGLALAGYWFGPGAAPLPPSLAPAAAPSVVPVEAAETIDERPVTVGLDSAAGVELTVTGGGRVTASACASGEAVAPGGSLLALHGVPLVSLAMPTPPWRDLVFGVEGADVEGLQAALAALGQSPGSSGRYDWATDAAWRAVVAGVGGEAAAGVFSTAQVLWLPPNAAPVGRCEAGLGGWLAPGAVVAVLGGGLTGAEVKAMPADLGAGARELVVDGVAVPVGADGAVAAADLAALAEVESVRSFLAGETDGSAVGSLRLTEPRLVFSLPPAAVVTDGPAGGCVVDEAGGLHRVVIAGSKLGRTFVQFDGPEPAGVMVGLDPRPDCR
jgi:hypothetical protein